MLCLDESAIRRIETWQILPAKCCSVDVNLLVAAPSLIERLTAGTSPSLSVLIWERGVRGKSFGRFAHLHSPERDREFLCLIASTEQKSHFRDQLWAEVVYLPSNVRSANVTVRPSIRSHEVVLGVSPGVPESDVIPLEELVVGVAKKRFYVRWPAAGRHVRFVAGHMLNDRGAPPVAQFLMQLGHDGIALFSSFDWGPAEGFPFLPRVQAGNLVLRPAEWRISKDVSAPGDTHWFKKWQQEWEVPRYICLSFGDNRLILDLDRKDHVQQVTAELKETRGRSSPSDPGGAARSG